MQNERTLICAFISFIASSFLQWLLIMVSMGMDWSPFGPIGKIAMILGIWMAASLFTALFIVGHETLSDVFKKQDAPE